MGKEVNPFAEESSPYEGVPSGTPAPAPLSANSNPFDEVSESPFDSVPLATPTATSAEKKQYKKRTWGDVGVEAAQNFVPNLISAVGSMAEAVMHPIDSIDHLSKTMVGLATNWLPDNPNEKVLAKVRKDTNSFIKQRYGDPARFLDSAQKDPEGVTSGFFEFIGKNFKLPQQHLVSEKGAPVVDQYIKESRPVANDAIKGFNDVTQSGDSFKDYLATRPAEAALVATSVLNPTAGVLKRAAKATDSKPLNSLARFTGNAANATNPLYPINLLARGIAMPIRKASELITPENKVLLEMTEGQPQAVINKLREPDTHQVPGYQPRADQKLASEGDTPPLLLAGLPQATRGLSAHAASAYKQRSIENNNALLNSLSNMGGNKASIAAREATRATFSTPLYKLADDTMVQLGDEFKSLVDRPSMKVAVDKLNTRALEQGQPIPFPATKNGLKVPSSLDGASLHYIKKMLDAQLENPTEFDIASRTVESINDTRKAYIGWLEQPSNNPAYGSARRVYGKYSAPVNQAISLDLIRQTLESKLGEGSTVRANAFATQLEKKIPEARDQTIEEIFRDKPDQLKEIYAIKKTLAAHALSKFMASGDSRKLGGDNAVTGALGVNNVLPNIMNTTATVANGIFNRLRGRISEKLAVELAIKLLVPEKAASAIEKAMRMDATKKQIGNALTAAPRAAYQVPQALNFLGQDQNEQP